MLTAFLISAALLFGMWYMGTGWPEDTDEHDDDDGEGGRGVDDPSGPDEGPFATLWEDLL